MLVEVLGEHGYDAIGASNGREALDTLTASPERPCVILLDLMMPVMDGWGFLDAIEDHPEWSSIPVVACTAFADRAEVVKAKEV
ncbi:MAG TPA: response regulator, partial [Kofleriaceae bacterium]